MDDPRDETDGEQRHRLWRGVRRAGLVQWVSLGIVLALVITLFWLAMHYSGHPDFETHACAGDPPGRASGSLCRWKIRLNAPSPQMPERSQARRPPRADLLRGPGPMDCCELS